MSFSKMVSCTKITRFVVDVVGLNARGRHFVSYAVPTVVFLSSGVLVLSR